MSENINFLKSWILFFIITTVAGALAGFVIGGILGVILGMMNHGDLSEYTFLLQCVAFIISLPISFFTYKWSIKKYILQKNPTANQNLEE